MSNLEYRHHANSPSLLCLPSKLSSVDSICDPNLENHTFWHIGQISVLMLN